MAARKFTPDEVSLIHRTMMAGASKDDVALFVQTCERTGLDPFARQIMPSSRKTQKDGEWVTQWTWIVTIDGLRKIAIDSGDYEGQEGPFWCGPDGKWVEIWTKKEPPFAAKVLVHRKNFRTGLSGIAKYDSYVQKKRDGQPNQVWSNFGDHMTAKCAEALALRKAFPNETAGLYTQDEMGQSGFEPTEAIATPTSVHKPASAEPEAKGEWSIDDLEEFETTKDRAWEAFNAVGKPEDEFNKFMEPWLKRKKTDPSEKVLTGFAAIVNKLEDAAKKKKNAA